MEAKTKMKSITPAEFNDLVGRGKGVELIDVSTPTEFAEFHVPCAKNLPIDSTELSCFADELENFENRTVYVMCRGGARSAKVCEQWNNLNFVSIDGGTKRWAREELPLIRQHAGFSPERKVRIIAGSMVVISCILALTVHPYMALVAGFVGTGLVFAGITDICLMSKIVTLGSRRTSS